MIYNELHLTAFPDTNSDAMNEKFMGSWMRLVVEKGMPLPDREVEECAVCGSDVINFISRDFRDPKILFGGCICTNNNCTVLYLCVTGSESS